MEHNGIYSAKAVVSSHSFFKILQKSSARPHSTYLPPVRFLPALQELKINGNSIYHSYGISAYLYHCTSVYHYPCILAYRFQPGISWVRAEHPLLFNLQWKL